MEKLFELFSATAGEDRFAFQRWFLDSFAPRVLEAHPAALGYAVTLIDVTPKPLIPMRQDMPVLPPPMCDVVTETWLANRATSQREDLPSSHADLAASLRPRGKLAAAYRISEQRRFDRHPQAPLGAATRGLKFYAFMRWNDGLTAEDARRMWTEHLNIVNRIHSRMSKYIQNWVDATIVPGALACDGIAQLYYEQQSDFEQHHYGTLENRDAVRADTTRFNKGSIPLFGTEYVLRRFDPA